MCQSWLEIDLWREILLIHASNIVALFQSNNQNNAEKLILWQLNITVLLSYLFNWKILITFDSNIQYPFVVVDFFFYLWFILFRRSNIIPEFVIHYFESLIWSHSNENESILSKTKKKGNKSAQYIICFECFECLSNWIYRNKALCRSEKHIHQ